MKTFDFYKTSFRFVNNRVVFQLEEFTIDGEKHNCLDEGIYKGPFIICFDRPLEIYHGNIQEISYKDKELSINNSKYKYEETDFVFFLGDFGADDDKSVDNALNSIMSRFCEYILKEYS